MVEIAEEQVNLAKTRLLENANQGDLGVLEIRPTHQMKGKAISSLTQIQLMRTLLMRSQLIRLLISSSHQDPMIKQSSCGMQQNRKKLLMCSPVTNRASGVLITLTTARN
jgi:hypothetical protein